MQRKTTLATITITILAAAVGFSNLAYAHVDICAGSDNGKPFNEIWTAICDLQGQIDNFEKKHNDQLINVGIKRVQLIAATCTNNPTINPTPFGWCPDSTKINFLISDPSLTNLSVVSVSTVSPPSSGNPIIHCRVDSVNFVEGSNSGFLVSCDNPPLPGTILNYVIFFDSTPIKVGTITSPPVGTTSGTPVVNTNSPHDDDKKSKSNDDDKKSKSNDDDKKSKSHDD